MAAVQAPPAEAEPVVEPVVEPEAPASPEAVEAGEAQEEQPEAGTGLDLKELLKDATPEELRMALEAAPEGARAEALAEDLRRAEQRGATRAQEELTARSQRSDAYQGGIAQGKKAEAWVAQAADTLPSILGAMQKALEFSDTETAKQHMQAIAQTMNPQGVRAALTDFRTGVILEQGQRMAGEFNNFIGSKADIIGTLSDDEMKSLSELAYKDGQTGQTRTQYALMEIMLERAEQRGIEKGIQKGLKDKEASVKLAEKMTGLMAAKNGGAPKLNGTAAVAAGMTYERLTKLSQAEQAEFKQNNPAKFNELLGIK